MSLLYDCNDAEDRADGLSAAAGAIRRGDLVVMPTDTVYGVAADAFSPSAVDEIFRAKGRGRNMPSPVLVGSWAGLDGLVLVVDSVVRELIEAFWPGGLSIIVEHAPSLEWDLGETRGTVMVRMPAHPVAIDLLTETGPLAVTSANKTGQAPPMTAEQAREQLGDAVSVYLEAGASEGTPSSIVDLTGETPVLRRLGAVSVEALREVVSDLIVPEDLREPAKAEPAANGGAGGTESPDEPADGAQEAEPTGTQAGEAQTPAAESEGAADDETAGPEASGDGTEPAPAEESGGTAAQQ